MTPENTLGGDSSAPVNEPMPDPVIDPTVPETPVTNPDPVIDPTVPETPAPAPATEPTTPPEIQSLGDDPLKSLDQPANQDSSIPVVEDKKPKNTGKLVGIIVGAVVVIVLIILAIIYLPKLFSNVDTAKYDDDAFFAEEKNGSDSFAIFKRNGEQVTDFIYSNVSSFVNGHAAACERENSNKCGVVTSAGTISLAFGSYDSVSSAGGLYVVTRGSKRLLVNYTGKQIAELPSGDDANAELFIRVADLPFLIYNYGENKYKLYNGEGDELLDFETTSTPSLFSSNQTTVTFMSTGEKTYAIDTDKQTIIDDAETDKIFTSVKDISADGKTLILQTEQQKDKSRSFAMFINENVVPINGNECTDVAFVEDDNGSKMNLAYCKIDYSSYLINEKGEVTHESKYSRDRINANTYVEKEYVYDSETRTGKYSLIFTKDDKVVKKTEADDYSLEAIVASGYYVFYEYNYKNSDNYTKYHVFNTSGEEVFEYEFEESSPANSIYGPDSNGNYIITAIKTDENGKSKTYYSVIKPDGTTIFESPDNYKIREYHGLYLDGSYTIYGIYDKDGKQISPKGQKYYDVEMIGKNFIMATYSSNKVTDIYSLTGEKLTDSEKSVNVTVYKNYIAIKEGSNYKYYNIETGKLIYAQ